MASFPTQDPHQLRIIRAVMSVLPPTPRRGVIRARRDPRRARTSGGAAISALQPGSRRGVTRATVGATSLGSRSRPGTGGFQAPLGSGHGSFGAELLPLPARGPDHEHANASLAVGEGWPWRGAVAHWPGAELLSGGGPEQAHLGEVKNLRKALQVDGCSCFKGKDDPVEATPGRLGEGKLDSQCQRHGKPTPGCSINNRNGFRDISCSCQVDSCCCFNEKDNCGEATPARLGQGGLDSQCERHGKPTPGGPRNNRNGIRDNLILHDQYATSAEEFTQCITSKIYRVASIRLDSVTWETSQLIDLFSLLDGKKLQEIVAVNVSWPSKLIEFPIDNLERSELQVLRLCFFRIPEIFAYRLAESLGVLDISHCVVDTQHLYEFISICTQLKAIHLGFHKSSVKLRSESLTLIQIWMSSIDDIDIEHAPALKSLLASASPKDDRKMLRVNVRCSPLLHAITCNFSKQCVAINKIDIRMDNKRTHLCLRELSVGVEFLVERQRRYLISSLTCLTQLERLTIWRIDNSSRIEDSLSSSQDWSQRLGVPGCLQHLHTFTLEGFKGGALESSLACAILEHSPSIQFLTLEFDIDLPLELIQKVKKSINMVRQRFHHQVSIHIRKSETSGVKGSCFNHH